jgi:hypothetical protein
MPRKKTLQSVLRDLALPFIDGLAKAIEQRVATTAPTNGVKPTARTAAPKRAVGRPGPKRSSGLEAACTKLLSEIKRTPGLRNEQLAKATALPAPLVKRALAKLRGDDAVRTKGTRRATTYTSA